MRQNHRDIGEKEILDTLLNDSYSNDFNAIFSQYHLLVETTNEIGTRRENMNKFYLSLITILYGIITFLSVNCHILFSIVPILFVIIVSFSWKNHINQYKLLNEAKFNIINYLENYLPVYVFTKEWELLGNYGYNGLSKWDKRIANSLIIFSVVLIAIIVLSEHTIICNYINMIFN